MLSSRGMARSFATLCVLTSLAAQPASAQHRHADHDHAGHGDADHAATEKHQPAWHSGDAAHAHPGVALSHPIVVESPLPETKLRLNYSFSDGDERTNVFALEAEYAFVQNFSIEAVVPYVFVNPEDGASENNLDNIILAAKFASYRWVDQQFLPAIGVEVHLPTGDDDKGIGSDHVIELEPFLRVGAWYGQFEFIGTFAVGIPLNQNSEERDEEDFELAYGVSVLYHLAPNVQALLELTGESVFGAEDETALYISPGVTFQPLSDKSINFGIGVSLPLTDDRDFDYAVNAMCIFHL